MTSLRICEIDDFATFSEEPFRFFYCTFTSICSPGKPAQKLYPVIFVGSLTLANVASTSCSIQVSLRRFVLILSYFVRLLCFETHLI